MRRAGRVPLAVVAMVAGASGGLAETIINHRKEKEFIMCEIIECLAVCAWLALPVAVEITDALRGAE